jgi:hypothetical protein
MTALEMHNLLRLKLDNVSSFQVPSFQTKELDDILTDSQLTVVKTYYNGNPNTNKKGFEQNQKRTDDLRTLVVTDVIPFDKFIKDESNVALGKYVLKSDNSRLSERYMFYLKSYFVVEDKNCIGKFYSIWPRQTQHDDFATLMSDPFWKPTPKEPKLLFSEEFVEMYFGKDPLSVFNSLTYYFTYLRYPNRISLIESKDCELPDHLHQEIVNTATLKLLEYIQNPRTQSFAQLDYALNE